MTLNKVILLSTEQVRKMKKNRQIAKEHFLDVQYHQILRAKI